VNPRRRIRGSLARDEGGFAARFILQTILIFALLGLIAYEGGTILVASIRVHDAASTGADAGADAYYGTKNADRARGAVVEAVLESDPEARVTHIDISSDGVVTVTAVSTANTLVVSRVSFLKHFGVVHGTEAGSHFG
jgi:Flp pilus assembly protein TadG